MSGRAGVGVEERIDALATAMELLGDEAPGGLVDRVADDLLRAHERTGLDSEVTVVSLVGATGSGKSSLFNALTGADLAPVGVLRPTTREALAAVAPGGRADRLLDWVGVPRRVVVPAGAGLPPGVVLVDLPDIDSVSRSNRDLASRLGARTDVLVWVLDPQKYADDVIHSGWIAPLTGAADVAVAVLTQVDLLDAAARRAVTRDLRRLLDEDGAASARLLEASAVTGEGLDTLRALLEATARRVREKALRVNGVLDDAVAAIGEELGDVGLPPFDPEGLGSALVGAATRASGADRVAAAVRGAHLHRGVRATGWMPLRWMRSLRADPLRRLHLDGAGSGSMASLDVPPVAAAAELATGVRRVVDEVGRGRPDPWRRSLSRLARGAVEGLAPDLDRAIARTDLAMGRPPRWWGWADAAQWTGWALAAAGALWVAVVAVAGQFLLLDLPVPVWRGLPVPTWMVIAGLAWTLVVVWAARPAVALGARRRERRAARALEESLLGVLEERLVEPLVAEDRRQHTIVESLDRATRR